MKEIIEYVKEYGFALTASFGLFFSAIRFKQFMEERQKKALREIIGTDIKDAIQPLSEKLDSTVKCFEDRFNELQIKDTEFVTKKEAFDTYVTNKICNHKHGSDSERIIRG